MNSREITGEWVEDMVGRVLGKKMQFDVLADQLFEELLDVYTVNSNSDQNVADQLFPGDANGLDKWLEIKAAMQECRTAFTGMDLSKLRRVANFSTARMG